jgi:glutamate racemase
MQYVLVIDSGFGGATFVKTLHSKSNLNIIFYVENKLAPLGEKSKEELLNQVKKIINKIKRKYEIKIVLFACNTLTITCLYDVRQIFKNLIFFGTVPSDNKCENALILCTSLTAKNLNHIKNCKVVNLPKLASLIDEFYPKKNEIKNYLKLMLKQEKDVKSVVLGCTHYCLVEKEIETVTKIKKIYNSKLQVIKKILSLTKKINLVGNGKIYVTLSKKDENFKNRLLNYILL